MKIDGRKARKMTPNQLRFLHEYCYHTLTGKQSASESARKAGYSEKIARKTAYELTDPNKYPLVAEAIYDLKKELTDKYSVNMDKHLARLDELGKRAEEKEHYSAAINAEGMRGKASGLYDPTIRMESAIENLSRDQLVAKLDELQRKGVGIRGEEDVIDVTPEKQEAKMIED